MLIEQAVVPRRRYDLDLGMDEKVLREIVPQILMMKSKVRE